MVAESTALVVRESAPPVIVPRTLADMIDIAERLSKSSLLPEALRGKVPEVLMQMMAGQELGLFSMASLRSFHIIKGKPVMGSDAMVAVVLASGKAEYFRRVGEGTDKAVTYATKRRGLEEQRCTWTWEMAKTASLTGGDNWRGYPRAMLASRAKSELARDVYPDVLAGCYTADEISDRAPSSPQSDVVDAEFVETKWSEQPAVMAAAVTKGKMIDAALGVTTHERAQAEEATRQMFSLADYPEIAEAETAVTMESLKATAAKFGARKLGPGPAHDAMSRAYKASVQRLKAPPTSGVSSSAVAETPVNSATSSDASTGEST